MTNNSRQEAAAAVDPEAPAVLAPANIGEGEEALRLVAQLGFALAPNLTGIGPAPHRRAFKLYVVVNFFAVSLDLLLVVYLLLILTRSIKPPVSAEAKRLMWASLAATYLTFVVGNFIELVT